MNSPYVANNDEPDWLDDLTLAPGPPWLSMGLHALDLDRWLLPGDDVAAQLDEKRRLLADRHVEVFAALDGTETAGAELLALIVEWLAARLPDAPRQPDPELHPLDAAARLVAEDLCLLRQRDSGWHLDAASLCFPSYWLLADKLGQPIGDVHQPVAHYDDELRRKVDVFFDRLRVDHPVWRRNWSIHDDPTLFLPAYQPTAGPIDVDDAGERLFLRSEYQTLRRLAASGAIVFTIRTQQVPLAALAGRPDICGRLATAVRAWSPELAAYKGDPARTGAILGWLDRRAAAVD